MNITLNGSRIEVSPGTSVAALVSSLSDVDKGIAVAMNSQVVRRSEWITTLAHENCTLEIITAVQGG